MKVFSGAREEKEKEILNLNINDIEAQMNDLKQSSESLRQKFLKLVMGAENCANHQLALTSEAHTLKRKDEQQLLERKRLEDTLKVFKEKKLKLYWLGKESSW